MCVFCACQSTLLIELSVVTYSDKCLDKQRRKSKTVKDFLKWNIYMIIQSQNAPINKLSRSKARKTQQICHYKHTRKNSELLLLFNTGVSFSLRNNFAKSGSFAKVSVPIHNYNSLLGRDWKW